MRSRFGLSMFDIGDGITYLEAVMLVAVLMRDPSSWLCAAWNEWQYPVSREWIVNAHLYDLTAAVNAAKGRKPKPYPNPFPSTEKRRFGKTDKSPDEVKALLARMNPQET